MSPRELALRLALYQKDFQVFAREQLQILPKFPIGSPPIGFRLNIVQERINVVAERQLRETGKIRLVVLKARQPGSSTWSAGRLAHLALLQHNIQALTVAHDDGTAQHLFGILRLFYEGMAEDFRPMIRYNTKSAMEFDNPSKLERLVRPGLRSSMLCNTAKNAMTGTGHTLQAVQLSECAKYDNPETLWASLMPAVPDAAGTVVILESTAFVTGNWFRERCAQARAKRGSFWFVFPPWYLSAEYQLPIPKGEKLRLEPEEKEWKRRWKVTDEQVLWYRTKIIDAGGDAIARELVRQEYPFDPDEAWITLSLSVFDPRALQQLHERVGPPQTQGKLYAGPKVLEDGAGELSLWEEPVSGEQYDIGADPATGIEGGDWVVACVVKRRNREQVAEWRGRVDPFAFADILYNLGMYYNTAQVGVEVDGIGFATNDRLVKMGYQYCVTPDQRLLTADLQWIAAGDCQAGDAVVGFDEKIACGRRSRRYQLAEILACAPRLAPVYRIVLSDGTELKATGEHPWLIYPWKGGSNGHVWRATNNLRIGDILPKFFSPWRTMRTYDAGWMAGIIDGEGSVGYYHDKAHGKREPGGGAQMAIAQNPGEILERIISLLTQWGISHGIQRGSTGTTRYVTIGRKSAIAQLLGMTRPVRLLPKWRPEWLAAVRAESQSTVEAIEYLGEREIIGLQTTTETYIAEGYAAHNTYIWRTRGDVLPQLTKHSGWKTTQESKRYLISLARHMLQKEQFIIHSPVLWHEMRAFAQTGVDSYQATAGAHDDCVMAWLIALAIGEDEAGETEWMTPQVVIEEEKVAWRDPATYEGELETGDGSALDQLITTMRGW